MKTLLIIATFIEMLEQEVRCEKRGSRTEDPVSDTLVVCEVM